MSQVSVNTSTPSVISTPKRVAVVLAGCGAQDGAEITEATSLLIALTQQDHKVSLFAPNRLQQRVVQHTDGQEQSETRNILVESARIARGQIQPITQLKADNFDALAFAGGFGVAYNLCNFAIAGLEASLENDVKAALFPFIQAKKPVAAMCIAPVLLGIATRELSLKNVELTLGQGDAKGPIEVIESWGAKQVNCETNQACVDTENRFVTAPAYMVGSAQPWQIFDSALALVKGLGQLF